MTIGANGTATILNSTSKQLVRPDHRKPTAPRTGRAGRCTYESPGSPGFVISVTGNGQKVTVTGEFVSIASSDGNATLGAYTGLPGGATSVELTK